jgi:tetratricopeptide (TPR) repeat protein
MAKRQREYIDKNHKVMSAYYDLCEKYCNGSNVKTIKRQLKQLIEKDQDFLDSYLLLCEILQNDGNLPEAEKILDEAYERALRSITDKKGNWPEVLEWGWLENRHIIRTILNKAISLWEKGEIDGALDLFRKLLKTNPRDNVGARDFILAIRMNMSFEEFENRFNKGGYYDMELSDWFEENRKSFPDEFGWWEKAVEKYM